MQKVRLYTKNMCPYCESAKRLFKTLGVAYEEENLENKPEERMRLSEAAGGWRTMPMIWVGDEFIGGFNDVEALHKRGEFLPKIERA